MQKVNVGLIRVILFEDKELAQLLQFSSYPIAIK